MQLPLSLQAPKMQSQKPIEIKISTVVAVSVILRESNLALLNAAMQAMTGGEADYFDYEFAVIDLGSLDLVGREIDWPALITLFKSYRLNPVAVRNATPEMEPAILAYGLSLDVVVKPRSSEPERAPVVAVQPVPPPVIAMPFARNAMVIDTPVRAGQRIYARDTDLIVTACVNNGAEVIADGSIHIYAPLRGRALAGANGNADVRIFTLSMEAELISIAGFYRTFEDGLPAEFAGRSAEVRLTAGRIDVRTMQSGSKS